MQFGLPDLGFLQRTYRVSALLGALGMLALSGTAQWRLPMGWAAGVALGLLVLKSKELLCRALVAGLQKQAPAPFVGHLAGSYLAGGLLLWGVVRFELGNLLALMAGLTMVLFVIVAKAIGWHQMMKMKQAARVAVLTSCLLFAHTSLVLASEGAGHGPQNGEAHGTAQADKSPFAQEHGCWLDPVGAAIGLCRPKEHHHNCWAVIAWLVALGLIGFAMLSSRNMKLIPSGAQNLLEMIVEGLTNFSKSIIGESKGPKYAPLIGTFFLYIFSLNVIGLIPGLVSPTANPNVTIALALTAFLIAQGVAIHENGVLGQLNHLANEPGKLIASFPGVMKAFAVLMIPLLFTIHVVGELAKPISLSMRLLGNIFGEDMVLVKLATLGSMLGLPSVLKYLPFQFPIQCLALMTSVIQALVFSALLAVYISMSLPHEHHDEHDEAHGEAAHAH